MRGVASVVAALGLAGLLWAGLSFRASEAKVEVRSAKGLLQADANLHLVSNKDSDPVPPTPAVRRALFNQKMQAMVSDGQFARLTDSASGRAVQNPGAGAKAAVQRTGYRPPRLDLTTPPVVPDNDLDCLTQAIYYEARNESEAGQAAVAEVVMNRVRHRAYPNRICDVVYQRNIRTCQFTFTCDGSIGRGAIRHEAWARARRIAEDVYSGQRLGQLPSNSVNYHANYVRPSWGQRLSKVRQIGAHIFYGAPLSGGSTPGSASTDADQGPVFVRNPAIEQAYERLMAGAKVEDAA